VQVSRGTVYLRGKSWTIGYSVGHVRFREAIGTNRQMAEAMLKKRIVEAIEGRHFNVRNEGRIPFSEFAATQTRAQAVTPLIEAGKIFLPQSAPWASDFVEEMACFPNGAHDDVVDATTQALNYLRVKPELWAIVLGPSSFDRELDREALWEKAMLGYPMTEAEIARM
jgi:predicted phage terminase large subunit-like protein